MKLFLDANVLFSAAYSARGNARALVAAALQCDATLLCSAYVLGEARRNVAAKAPHALDALGRIETVLHLVPNPLPTTEARARGLGVVSKDVAVLAAALDALADRLVTGDARHFGHLYGRTIDGVQVTTLRAAYEALGGV